MSRLRNISPSVVVAAGALAIVWFCVSVAFCRDPGSATVHGTILDSKGSPLVEATVFLTTEGAKTSRVARTDLQGQYRLSDVPAGRYSVRAAVSGYKDATSGLLTLTAGDQKEVDLVLTRVALGASVSPPQFFDEPQFTVAGVAQTGNAGGHGSDTVLRNTEALTKATVSLSKQATLQAAEEKSLRDAVARTPSDPGANYRLGKVIADKGNTREATPYLERARVEARALLVGQDKADLHHLLGDVEESLGNPLDAVREYERAAQMEPSEPNLFDWGAELLAHRAFEPATEVFARGNRLFPRSTRMLVALGVTWYARGAYEQAAQRICDAADLDPNNPAPYLFLGRMESVETVQLDGVVEKLARFAKLQPDNALANYYYAISLHKRAKAGGDDGNLTQVETLLQEAVRLDPTLAAAYLQLGIVAWERKDLPQAIAYYQQTVKTNPNLPEAHYRLSQAYTRTGDKAKAQEQLQLYDQLSRKSAEEVERERRELQQFVYTLRAPSPPK